VENVEATYIIELAADEEFDINKIEFVEPSDTPEVFEDCFVADHILYDGKEIVTDSLSDYSAEDMFNSPGWDRSCSYLAPEKRSSAAAGLLHRQVVAHAHCRGAG